MLILIPSIAVLPIKIRKIKPTKATKKEEVLVKSKWVNLKDLKEEDRPNVTGYRYTQYIEYKSKQPGGSSSSSLPSTC